MTVLKERGFHEAPTDRLARQSYPGMAHFAGTGPGGATCNKCTSYDFDPVRDANKFERPCTKFKALTGKLGKAVPGQAAACRHFEQRKK